MKGRSCVRTSIRRARSLPTRRFAATCPFTCGSQPPRATRKLKGHQLSRRKIKTAARQVVSEAICREQALNVLLVLGCRLVERLHTVLPDDLTLDRESLLQPVLQSSRGLPRQRKCDTPLGQNVIGSVQEVIYLRDPDIRDGLVENLLCLDRCYPNRQCSAQHHAVLADGLRCDDSCKLNHQPYPPIELAMLKHFIKGEVVEQCDELRIGRGQGRNMPRK